MTISHAGSNLGLKDYLVPVDYDDKYLSLRHHNSSGRGDHPVSEIVSRHVDSRWGSVISVEDATVNILKNPLFMNTSSWSHGQNDSVGTFTASNNWGRITAATTGSYYSYIRQSVSTTIAANDTYTFSITVKNNVVGKFGLRIVFSGPTVEESTRIITLDGKGGEIRHSYTLKSTAAKTSVFADILLGNLYFGTGTVGQLDFTMAQLELKPFATSFVEGSRALGELKFDKSLVPLNNMTINMWISHTGDTRTASPIYKIISLGTGAGGYGAFTLWNYYPITSDAGNRRMIADFGSNDTAARQYHDLLDPVLFVPGQWDMITLSLDTNNKIFKAYRNGKEFSYSSPSTYSWTKMNLIENLTLSNSGWKYSNLLISPRLVGQSEIQSWYEYGRHFYDPYDYQVVYG